MPRLKGGNTLVPISIRVSDVTDLTLKAIKDSGVDINTELRLLVEDYVKGAVDKMGVSEREALLAELCFGKQIETPKKKEKNTAESRFNRKLEAGNFDEFTGADWCRYFEHKSKARGLAYVRHPFTSGILKSVMAKYDAHLIKCMIDFIYDSPQTEFDVSQSPILCLSKSWITFTLNNSQAWMLGTYQVKSKHKKHLPKRESTSSRERKSKKSLGDGVDI